MTKIGAHISASGGVQHAPLNAAKEHCEVFQFFLSSPQSYAMNDLPEASVAEFKKNCRTHGFTEYYVHAPYIINIASPNNRIRYGSITLLRKSLERCSLLGVRGMMFHTGSGKGQPSKAHAIKKAIEAINKILDGYTGTTKLLIENAAGAGDTLGVSFHEVSMLLHGAKQQDHVGVCLDTQHAFASGYDWRKRETTNAAIKEFAKEIGNDRLMLIQANDSKTEYNSHKDRHEHIGKGYIGVHGFRNVLRHPQLKNKSFILETEPTGRAEDIATLRSLRNNI